MSADTLPPGYRRLVASLSLGQILSWAFVYYGFSSFVLPMMAELGWRSLGVLELTALPSLGPERWRPGVDAADVLLVNGGDGIYLDRWMRESGLAALLPSLSAVYVGLSSGSFVMGPSIDDVFASWTPA